MREIEIAIQLDEGAELPRYATVGSAGMDLCSFESAEIQPMERKMVRTGLRIAIPEGFEGQVRPRSGLAIKQGLTVVNAPGTIDSDYRGEVNVLMINLGTSVVKLAKGDRIAQLVICPIVCAQWNVCTSLDNTDRGEGGFGSTG